jgi:hypothetical protein
MYYNKYQLLSKNIFFCLVALVPLTGDYLHAKNRAIWKSGQVGNVVSIEVVIPQRLGCIPLAIKDAINSFQIIRLPYLAEDLVEVNSEFFVIKGRWRW